MAKKKVEMIQDKIPITNKVEIPLVWLKASYSFHTFAYRDPRAVFASAAGSPVVSPTTVLLGIVSTLFSLGKNEEAKGFISVAHYCKVIVDSPEGMIFFRAFHQLRRYESNKWDKPAEGKINMRIGLTNINQGTREYGLVDGQTTIYIGVPEEHLASVRLALVNLGHLGTHDSMCSLVGDVEICAEPNDNDVVYLPPERWKAQIPTGATAVTLSRFKEVPLQPALPHWYMAGDKNNTEIVPYFIKGRFEGTSKGEIYKKF